MVEQISCPHCGQKNYLNERICQQCGVDLAFAAALAFQILTVPDQVSGRIQYVPEILVPRIGEVFVEQGLLSAEKLQAALAYQAKCLTEGKPILIGQALLELKYVDRQTLDQVVTVQILKLQAALQQSNAQLSRKVQERTHEYQHALEQIADLNQVKSNFLSTISHELRTPLTTIKGYLELLLHGELGPIIPEQLDALARLEKAESKLESLIEDLINFSLAARGELSLELKPTDIGALIPSCIERVQEKAKKQNIQLSTQIPLGLPQVLADKEKIKWVIFQLLDNAIKFTPSGGWVNIQASQNERVVCIKVIDTGIGIPKDRIGEIFVPFHQLDRADTRRFSGTGLGLALSCKILEAHFSQIEINSVVGEGSRFQFDLPIHPRK